MDKNTTTTASDSQSAPASPSKIQTLAGGMQFISTAIAKQNDINVVSLTIEKLDGKTPGQPAGERIRLELSGDGVDNPTRRYFLRENSAFATGVESVGLHSHAPKKERGSKTYTMYFGLDAKVVGWEPPAPPKAEKKLLSPEERKQRRQDGKANKRAERAAAAAAEAEAAAAGGVTGASASSAKTPAKETVKA